jgi:hypothetical protein
MVGQRLMDDPAFFLRRDREVARRGGASLLRHHHLLDGLPFHKRGEHEARESRFEHGASARGPRFGIDRRRDRLCGELNVAEQESAVLHRGGVGCLSPLRVCAVAYPPDPCPAAVAVLPHVRRAPSAATIKGALVRSPRAPEESEP